MVFMQPGLSQVRACCVATRRLVVVSGSTSGFRGKLWLEGAGLGRDLGQISPGANPSWMWPGTDPGRSGLELNGLGAYISNECGNCDNT